jgi:hypothetical protein
MVKPEAGVKKKAVEGSTATDTSLLSFPQFWKAARQAIANAIENILYRFRLMISPG